MAYEQKDDSAHAKGTALIGGVEYWVDAWTNESANGTKYQSLKFKRKDAAQTGGVPQRQEPAHDTDLDDDIPF
jgi:hypothetical protein